MSNYILICRSLTYAQRAVRVLERSGIPSVLFRTPQELSKGGCGYSVKIKEKYLATALKALKRAELSPLKIYSVFPNGTSMEVPQ